MALETSSAASKTCAWGERVISNGFLTTVSHEEVLGTGQIVLLTGSARGTCAAGGTLPKENSWQVPAAWKAVVRDGQIAQWHVYADNQPARKIMGESSP
jgi:hypothetical protein